MTKGKRRIIRQKNTMFDDQKLGLAERGLLVTLMYFSTERDLNFDNLLKLLPDKKDSIQNCLNKLEEFGYLKRNKIVDGEGIFKDWEYVIKFSRYTEDEEE